MRKTGFRWIFRRNDDHALHSFMEWIKMEWVKGNAPTLQLLEADRSTSQNSMFYALYKDIAAAMQDKTLIEVKRECKLRYGVAILKAADPEWADLYDEAIKPMPYESKLLLMTDYPITSHFTKAQASDYIQTILDDYARQGILVPDPRAA